MSRHSSIDWVLVRLNPRYGRSLQRDLRQGKEGNESSLVRGRRDRNSSGSVAGTSRGSRHTVPVDPSKEGRG